MKGNKYENPFLIKGFYVSWAIGINWVESDSYLLRNFSRPNNLSSRGSKERDVSWVLTKEANPWNLGLSLFNILIVRLSMEMEALIMANSSKIILMMLKYSASLLLPWVESCNYFFIAMTLVQPISMKTSKNMPCYL